MAILGPEGTFSEEAFEQYYGAFPLPLRYENEIAAVFERVVEDPETEGLVPLWNSQAGSIPATVRMLIKTSVSIVGETVLPVRHCLLGIEGTRLEDLELVISQPAAFLQCERFLRGMLSNARKEIVDSTSIAAATVLAEGRRAVAIAPLRAAKVYGLTPLVEGIEDCDDNCTTFIHIANRAVIPAEAGKTSIVFSLKEEPGALYHALGVFAERAINLTRLESRPRSPGSSDYMFLADLDGGIGDSRIEEALRELAARASFYRLLGSYPVAAAPRRAAASKS
ncbi:MAG: prephenate dehydratase [Solirubrobacterales bacterium]